MVLCDLPIMLQSSAECNNLLILVGSLTGVQGHLHAKAHSGNRSEGKGAFETWRSIQIPDCIFAWIGR